MDKKTYMRRVEMVKKIDRERYMTEVAFNGAGFLCWAEWDHDTETNQINVHVEFQGRTYLCYAIKHIPNTSTWTVDCGEWTNTADEYEMHPCLYGMSAPDAYYLEEPRKFHKALRAALENYQHYVSRGD